MTNTELLQKHSELRNEIDKCRTLITKIDPNSEVYAHLSDAMLACTAKMVEIEADILAAIPTIETIIANAPKGAGTYMEANYDSYYFNGENQFGIFNRVTNAEVFRGDKSTGLQTQ